MLSLYNATKLRKPMLSSKTDYQQRGAWGMSASFDVHDCTGATITSADKIRQFVTGLYKTLDATPTGSLAFATFTSPEERSGFAAAQLGETVAVSIRTAAKANTLHLDIFSAVYFDPEKIASFSEEFFEAGDAVLHYILRK